MFFIQEYITLQRYCVCKNEFYGKLCEIEYKIQSITVTDILFSINNF